MTPLEGWARTMVALLAVLRACRTPEQLLAVNGALNALRAAAPEGLSTVELYEAVLLARHGPRQEPA